MNPSPAHIPFGLGHFDVCGPDIDSLASFYRDVLGWAPQPRGPGYASLDTPPGTVRGALVESETTAITIGIVVPDLDATLARVARCDGRIHMPPTDNGWVRKAQVRDPAGNLITLIEEKRD